MDGLRRLNRFSLDALIEREARSKSEIARDMECVPSTLGDMVSGRRDASPQMLHRLADVLNVDVRALQTDPYGIAGPLVAVAAAARELAPHINGHDFGLRDAIKELVAAEERVGAEGW